MFKNVISHTLNINLMYAIYEGGFKWYIFKYFTVISLYMTVISFIISKIYKNQLYLISLSLGMEMTVFIIFWSLFYYNKSLILGKDIKLIRNIQIHVFPVILCLIEFFTSKLSPPKIKYSFYFIAVIYYIIIKNLGIPYKFMENSPFLSILAICIFSQFLYFVLYKIKKNCHATQ